MPATYTHTTYPTGSPVTQEMYNRAHQNHVTNFTAASISSEVEDSTDMQVVVDPGEVGTEVVTTSILEDLQQIAKVLEEMRCVDPWYTSTGTVTLNLPIFPWVEEYTTVGGTGYLMETATVDTGVATFFVIPPDYRSGTITVNFYTNWASANLRLQKVIYGIAESRSITPEYNDTATYTTPGVITVSVTEALIALCGNQIAVALLRDADHADDTSTDPIFVHSCYLTYTGYRGVRGQT